MRRLLEGTVPWLAHFEHATVIVLGAEYVIAHIASLTITISTVVVLAIFHGALRGRIS